MSDPIIIASVRTGTVYPFRYVTKLRNMVGRHLRVPHDMVCLTDQPERCEGINFIDVSAIDLPGWWAKLILFEPIWRGRSQIIYFDLDTIILGDLAPLVDVPHEFAILESPVRSAGNKSYACAYNSSVMTIGAGRCAFVWERFDKRRNQLVRKHERYGDQAAIEELYPEAAILNRLMPKDFFINYRYLTAHKPAASVVNFGGSHKPHNCAIPWVQQEWV